MNALPINPRYAQTVLIATLCGWYAVVGQEDLGLDDRFAWDGREAVPTYAARMGLLPSFVIDLGGGVKLDLVLVPAGCTSVKGTPINDYERNKMWFKILFFATIFCGLVVLVMLLVPVARAVICWKRPQYSLAYLLLAVVFIGVLSALAALRDRYHAEQVRSANRSAELPSHNSVVPYPFYLGRVEVTEAQYQSCTGKPPPYPRGSSYPIDRISWNEAKEFCDALGSRLQATAIPSQYFQAWVVRLPTEQEFEFAAVGALGAEIEMDVQKIDTIAWTAGNSGGAIHPVGRKEPNTFGLYDLVGNVAEWANEIWAEQDPYYTQQFMANYAVSRGGSCYDQSDICRMQRRQVLDGKRGYHGIGFRVAITPKPKL